MKKAIILEKLNLLDPYLTKMQREKKPGQILVIMLIALSILSIFVVIVATSARRDVIQRVQNEQYEQALSIAEEKLLKFANSELNSNSPECSPTGNTIICNYPNELPEQGSASTVSTKVTITNENSFENLPVEKDTNVKILLNNYTGRLQLNWTGNVAWIISIDYLEGGRYKTARDTYDNTNIFTNPQHECYSTSANGGITVLGTNSIQINLNAAKDATAPNCIAASGVTYVALRLKPVMISGTVTNLSLTPIDNGFPAQVRKIVSETSADIASVNTPRAVVELIEPLYEAPIELFDYVFRSENSVTK